MSNNAWNRNGQGPPQASVVSPQGPVTTSFNTQEVRDCLKSGFGAVAPGDRVSLSYRPGGHTNNARSGGAWTSNPKHMNNGKDFYNELRKQISTMQHGGERAGG